MFFALTDFANEAHGSLWETLLITERLLQVLYVAESWERLDGDCGGREEVGNSFMHHLILWTKYERLYVI